MVYIIFEILKEKEGEMDILNKDDLISRQSLTVRDARSLGIEGDGIYLKIEGSKEALDRTEDLIKEHELGEKLSETDAQPINDTIMDEEESASEGMGMLF